MRFSNGFPIGPNLFLTCTFGGETIGMNNTSLRTAAILLHAIINFLLVNWLVNFDVTSKWLFFIGFIIFLLLLLFLFVKHIISFIYFIKSKTK